MVKINKKLVQPVKIINSGLLLFLREIANNPTAMGAACPSSKRLAAKIADQVPKKAGLVIELGGGTGVVTQALLDKGIKPEQLIVIERSSSLAKHLQNNFPQVTVIHGDACQLQHLLNSQQQSINAIVSSLPLRSLPRHTIKAIGSQLEQVLAKNTYYIQFTYGLYRAPLSPSKHLQCEYKEYIWRNLPPARIDVFRYVD